MNLLLDTNVVSELRKGARMNEHVRSWFAAVGDEEIRLSVLVLGELRCGIERVRGRDPRQAQALERWLLRLVRDHAARVLPVDERVAEEWGRLSAERPGSPVDLLMAATAKAHDAVLVTRNVRDVAWTGVAWQNPFAPPGRPAAP
jgi:predicted nucleic acid-binding protein